MATLVRIRKPLGFSGLNRMVPSDVIEDRESPNLRNVRVRFGEIRETAGRDILSGPVVGQDALYIGRFFLVDGTEWTFMLTENNLLRWGNSIPGTPRQWHIASGPSITGTRRFGVTSGEGYLFFSRKESGTGIYRWPGGTGAYALITGTGTAPPAKFVEYYNDRLIAANIIDSATDRTNRIRWSIQADHTNWSGTGSGFADLYSGVEEPITGLLSLNDRVVVYRKHTITEMYRTGTLSPVFEFQLRVNGIGCAFPYTIASNGQQHFFLGMDRTVYSWNGTQLSNIGERIRPELQDLVDYASAETYFGVVTPDRGEYWLVLGDGNAFVYDYVTDSWWRDSFPNITTLGEASDVITSGLLWSTATNTWATEPLTWDAAAGTLKPVIFAGRADGATFTVDEAVGYDYFAIGSILDCYIETPDYIFPSQELPTGDPMATGNVQRIFLTYTFTDATPFEVAISTDRGNAWQTQLVTPNTGGFSYVDFNVTGNICRFRFREADANVDFRWRHYVMEFAPAGDHVP